MGRQRLMILEVVSEECTRIPGRKVTVDPRNGRRGSLVDVHPRHRLVRFGGGCLERL